VFNGTTQSAPVTTTVESLHARPKNVQNIGSNFRADETVSGIIEDTQSTFWVKQCLIRAPLYKDPISGLNSEVHYSL
jgi:hypothetical protein